MKLLAVFGFVLAVAAIDKSASDVAAIGKPASDHPELPMGRVRFFVELFKIDSNNDFLRSSVLSMVRNGKICLGRDSEVTFPLVRYCLETGTPLPLKNLLEMDMINVAAFIFMFRVRGDEEAAEYLYNTVVENHFPAEFKETLHVAYSLNPLEDFKRLRTNRKRQFFMLWTLRMYGKRQEGDGLFPRTWFFYSEQAVLILLSMRFSPDLLIAGIILLQKELPVGFVFQIFSELQQMFTSLTGDEYLRLGESEKAYLRAFLERYAKFKWNDLNVLAEGLSGEELKQCQKVSELEGQLKCRIPYSGVVTEFAKHFCDLMQVGYPVFLLERMHNFFLKNSLFGKEISLARKCDFLKALAKALKMVEKGECPNKEFICSQIKYTISECKKEVNALKLANQL